jgi:(R,R)-butanediol dehydrogenase/meso-butanediol dehydrogenase/diacetyl reductase
MIENGLYPVEKVVTSEIAADDVVEKGLKELLNPSGRNLKVLVRM